MNNYAQLVRQFYTEIWNNHDTNTVATLLHDDFTFRGSLGTTLKGHNAFIDYVNTVHTALADYHCTIEDLVSENNRVFARMTFSGHHRAELLGHAATHKQVKWSAAALFVFADEKITDLWVLGDLKSLEQQLSRP